MKKILLLSLACLLLNTLSAQTAEKDTILPVQMNYVYSLDKAMELSRTQNKPIFVNCYADWALPCRGMDRAVFNVKLFADWMNANFVCLWLDMIANQEGQNFAKKYDVKSYAHYLVLDANAKIVHRIVGGSALPGFQHLLERALSSETSLAGTNQSFIKGNRNIKFLREYLITLQAAEEKEKYADVLKIFMDKLPPNEVYKKENWEIISRQIDGIESPMFLKIEREKEKFALENSLELVQKRLTNEFWMPFFQLATGGVKYKDEEVKPMLMRLKKLSLSENNVIYIFNELAVLRKNKNYNGFISLLERETETLNGRVREILDTSLADETLTREAAKPIITYLTKQRNRPGYEKLRSYNEAISKLENIGFGIQFEKGSFVSILAKAKTENKLVFLDAYTTWCGPCKMMTDRVFPQKKVGEFFNPRFLSIKIDMEKGEGKNLAKKYGIKSYPTMLLLDNQGNVIHKIIGAKEPDALIESIREGLSDSTSYGGLIRRYNSGDRSSEFLARYYETLNGLNELTDGRKQIIDFLKSLNLDERAKPNAWRLFYNFVDEPGNSLSVDFLKNYTLFSKALGENQAERKVVSLLLKEFEAPYTDEQWKSFKLNLASISTQVQTISVLTELISAFKNKNYPDIIDVYENKVAHFSRLEDRIKIDSLLFLFLKNSESTVKERAKSYATTGLTLKKNIPMYENLIQNFAN